MKKLLTCLTLSFSILISSSVLATNANTNNSIILHVNNSNYDQDTNTYNNTAMDENGFNYYIESDYDISNKWLDTTINQYGEITGYTFLK